MSRNELPPQLKERWDINCLIRLTGESDWKEAARALADKELDALLQMRKMQDFPSGVPILDTLSLYPQLFPLFLADETDGKLGRIVREKTDTGPLFKIILNWNYEPTEQRFTIAHEFAHFLVALVDTAPADSESQVRSSLILELFCNEFAKRFLLPERMFTKWFQENGHEISLKNIDEGIKKFQVTPHLFITRLAEERHMLDKVQKCVVLSTEDPQSSQLYPDIVVLPPGYDINWSGGFKFNKDHFPSAIEVFRTRSGKIESFRDAGEVIVARNRVKGAYWLDTTVEHKVYYGSCDGKIRHHLVSVFDLSPLPDRPVYWPL